jgi:hypothetical protein
MNAAERLYPAIQTDVDCFICCLRELVQELLIPAIISADRKCADATKS